MQRPCQLRIAASCSCEIFGLARDYNGQAPQAFNIMKTAAAKTTVRPAPLRQSNAYIIIN